MRKYRLLIMAIPLLIIAIWFCITGDANAAHTAAICACVLLTGHAVIDDLRK